MNIAELATFRGGVSVDTITELSSASGVTADGVLLKDSAVSAASGVSTNTITEYASGSGVTVDGVLLKDGDVSTLASGTVTTTSLQMKDGQNFTIKNFSTSAVVFGTTNGGVLSIGATGGTETHNINGAINLTKFDAGTVRSGTYNPTVTKKAGTPVIAAQTVNEFRWLRVGNVVNISGSVNIDLDVAGYIEIKFSLPTDGGANNFADIYQAAGVASVHQISQPGSVFSVSGERYIYWGVFPDTSPREHTISATYTIV